jgi:hypothetical protein
VVWPEDPSFFRQGRWQWKAGFRPTFAGTVVYGPPPAKWTGTCQAGLGFTASMCNNKLIGRPLLQRRVACGAHAPAQEWTFEYIESPRDADGHGSHTLSTSGGNSQVDVLVGGASPVNNISGMAPRARVAAYKVCYNGNLGPGVSPSGCFNSDSVAGHQTRRWRTVWTSSTTRSAAARRVSGMP